MSASVATTRRPGAPTTARGTAPGSRRTRRPVAPSRGARPSSAARGARKRATRAATTNSSSKPRERSRRCRRMGAHAPTQPRPEPTDLTRPRRFEKCCDACRYGVCRAPRSKSERKHWSLRGLFKAVALMYAAGLGILACVVCCTFACLRWCDRLTARCERERQREKRRQRREDRRAKRRAKEIEEDLERRAFSFSLDSEGVETEPPPLSRIAEEDLSLDEDSDEEVARRKRSPLSLSPPSPSSRKRSSPKKQTPPRAARSPLRALSAYFGNKRKTRG
mmetsp:Transcript_21460/g.74066  ORF Transcript_21460/g.74066 Transcript_21460/m.74066 type:complete len:278 (-) Transcript_21460:18-851(-)